MKQALFYYYRLKVIEIIPVTEKVSRIVCAEGKYALKQSASDHIERICRYIQSLHLKMFVPVVMTVENHFYFVYQQRYYYLMPWLDFEEEMVEELKLRSYFQRICQLHNETFYVSQVQEGYFAKEIEWATKEVQCRRQFYEKLMVQSEKSDYKAPWHWQMLRLYREVMINLESGERYIQDYQNCVAQKKTCRLCFTYNHFDLAHYCFAKNQLVSLDQCAFNRPISDLYAVYGKLQDRYLDFENIESFYLNHFTLYDDEKLWLVVRLSLVPLIDPQASALDVCWRLEQLKRYLEMTQKIVKRLGFS